MIDNINSTNREEHCRMGKGGNSALVNIENPEAIQHTIVLEE